MFYLQSRTIPTDQVVKSQLIIYVNWPFLNISKSIDDYNRSIEFCEIMMKRFSHNQFCSNGIVFSDEAIISWNCIVNWQNSPYWAIQKPPCNIQAVVVGLSLMAAFVIEGSLMKNIWSCTMIHHFQQFLKCIPMPSTHDLRNS